MTFWELLTLPFTRLISVLSKRRADRAALREERLAAGLCMTCGEDPPYDGETECPCCAEMRCI
jgi:hypothetical protein